MKSLPALLSDVLVVFACVLALSPAAVAEQLSLQQAVARALENNPELAMDAPAREAALQEIVAGRSGFLPKVDFEQSYTGGNNPVFVFGTLLTQHRFGLANFAIPSLNRPDPVDNLQTRVTAQQTVWDAGRSRKRLDAARLGLELADRGHEENVRQVLLSVLDGYYSVSLAQEAWAAARTALDAAGAITSQARQRVETGTAVEADLLRGEAHLAAARQGEIRARGQLEMAQAALNRLMGEPLSGPPAETAVLAPTKFDVPSEETLIAEQRRLRPDYQRLLAELRQAEIEAGSRRAEFYPSNGAFAGWEADNPSLSNWGGSNWTAGVSLRWNLFAGLGDQARLSAARQRLEQKRRQVAAMDSAMALEIRRAMIQLRSAEQQVEVTRAAEAQARESVRILKNRYDAGLATMTDLLSAESARAAARASFAESIYRHRLSVAQLEFAAGLLGPTSKAMQP